MPLQILKLLAWLVHVNIVKRRRNLEHFRLDGVLTFVQKKTKKKQVALVLQKEKERNNGLKQASKRRGNIKHKIKKMLDRAVLNTRTNECVFCSKRWRGSSKNVAILNLLKCFAERVAYRA